ncbi:hypothetical protein N431DRAFT_354906 [Stipitochalara longipes BDJ]|nr:hypothetical protein N431DRAFT_354906 [Stipitochalara longipes BDJ]
MDTPDWPGINHMVHYRWGLIRFENSLEPGKRKRLKELFDEEVPALKKIKLSDILLTEEDIMTLDIGWDEALLERLQPANEPANHKRTTDDLLISLPQHHRFTTTGDNVEFSIQPKQRAKSEEPTLEACARQARQRYLDEAAHLPVEHDDSEMPATRARGKKRTHSVSQEDVVDLSSDTAPALPESGKQEEQEGGGEAAAEVSVSSSPQVCARLLSRPSASPAPDFDIANPQSQDTESIVISAKRIKPNSGEKVQEQSGTPDPQNPAKTVSTGNAGTLKSALDLQEGKGENASVEGNECGRKETNESQAPAKKWSYFDGYKTRKPSNIRDFGNPRPVAPVPGSSPSREHRSMVCVLFNTSEPEINCSNRLLSQEVQNQLIDSVTMPRINVQTQILSTRSQSQAMVIIHQSKRILSRRRLIFGPSKIVPMEGNPQARDKGLRVHQYRTMALRDHQSILKLVPQQMGKPRGHRPHLHRIKTKNALNLKLKNMAPWRK